MFSHLVTAAKGFLTRQDAGEASPNSATDNHSKMVTTTRRGKIAEEPTTANATNGTAVTNGKGKSGSARTGKKAGQNNKRRRGSVQDSEDENAQDKSPNGTTESKQEQKGSPGKGGHIRFGSEEPALQHEVEMENVSEPGSQNQDEDEDEDEESSDNEAPETIDNSAQLSKIKLQAQKREQARQRSVNSSSLFQFISRVLTILQRRELEEREEKTTG